MKYLKKVLLLPLFILLGCGIDSFAYTYRITNETGGDVKVQLHYEFGKLNKKFKLIKAGDTYKFKFGGFKILLCLTKIMVSRKESGKWEKLKEAEKKRELTAIDRAFFDEWDLLMKISGMQVTNERTIEFMDI